VQGLGSAAGISVDDQALEGCEDFTADSECSQRDAERLMDAQRVRDVCLISIRFTPFTTQGEDMVSESSLIGGACACCI
jgi:hypothetical protein